MRQLFRLSQKFKLEVTVDQYAPVLSAAFEAWFDTPLEVVEFQRRVADESLLIETPETFQRLLVGYFCSQSAHWERLNARRLELEALRPEHRLSAVHENAVVTLRGELKLINLRSDVNGSIASSDIPTARRKQKELDHWSYVVRRMRDKLGAALRRLRAEQPDLFSQLNLPALALKAFDLGDPPSQSSVQSQPATTTFTGQHQGPDQQAARTATASGSSKHNPEELTAAVDQLIHQAVMLRLRAGFMSGPDEAQELFVQVDRTMADAEKVARHLRDHFQIDLGDMNARMWEAVGNYLSEVQSRASSDTVETSTKTEPEEFSGAEREASRQIEAIFAPGRTDPNSLLIATAWFQRYHYFGEPVPLTSEQASGLRAVPAFIEFLHFLDWKVKSGAHRQSLSPQQLWLHLYEKILSYAYTNDPEHMQHISSVYLHAIPHLSVPERLRLLDDVFCALYATRTQCYGMIAFMLLDPHFNVQSTAALNLAQLAPIRDGDSMTGIREVLSLAHSYNQNHEDDQRVAAWMCGLLALGDRRIVPVLHGVWDHLGPIGQSVLAHWISEVHSVTAAHADFCMNWLEAVIDDPNRSGNAARALSALGVRAAESGVVAYERRFPAPVFEPRQTDDDTGTLQPALTRHLDPPAIRVIGQWSRDDVARDVGRYLHGLNSSPNRQSALAQALVGWGPSAIGVLD